MDCRNADRSRHEPRDARAVRSGRTVIAELPIASDLETLHTAIRACDLCVRTGHLERAAPRAWGYLAPAPFMVIGQAPAIIESVPGGEMYRGPAGQKLRGWLRQAGFTDEDFGQSVYMTAITKCFPGRLPGNSKDRAPSRAEQVNCRPWLDRQMEFVQPKVLILFGKMAIDTFLGSNYPLEMCVGKAFRRQGRILLPLPHSSGASTWLNDPGHRALVEQAIALISVVRAGIIDNLPLSEELFASNE